MGMYGMVWYGMVGLLIHYHIKVMVWYYVYYVVLSVCLPFYDWIENVMVV